MLYRVLQPMTLHPGALLGLTAEQAAARSFGLVPQGVQWLVVKPVSFKAGEKIEHAGDLPKALAQAVEPAQPEQELPPASAATAPTRSSKPPRKAARAQG